jgi:hypothetical protein
VVSRLLHNGFQKGQEMTTNENDFDFEKLYDAYRDARARHLTLCVTRSGEWAQLTGDAWLPGQIFRATANYSREGFERDLRACIEAVER